ncbi:MAG TPA: glycine cleavage system protein GcvH, partial [Chthoniobacterales bacterium]|nr:glycine cleavage system protein GcvH [Chthoniobacterales bacterium]
TPGRHREKTVLQKIMNVPDDLFYTESHEWVRVEGENARVGISDHAQAELTDVVYVELPKVGAKAEAKGQIAVVESVKAASDIYAPVSGTVVEVNKALEGNPALINTDPFGEGWIFLLKMDSPDDVKQLKDAAGYRAAIG